MGVFGKPIVREEGDTPETMHARYVESIVHLGRKYAPTFGYNDLEIELL
jgi:hypothetical protein